MAKKTNKKTKSTKEQELFDNKCIKCGTDYRDEYPDAYYCESCKAEHQRLAKEIAAKTPASREDRSKRPDWDILNQGGVIKPFADGNSLIFSPSTYKRKP